MANKRSDILAIFETRMKGINGTGSYVFNLANNVQRVLERPNFKREDFTTFPQMLYKTRPNTRVTYKLAGLIEELFEVEAFTGFDGKLTGTQFDDFVSDVELALGTDISMSGNAAYFVPIGNDGRWLEQENITEVLVTFSCLFRKEASQR